MREALINGETMQIPEVEYLTDITTEGYYAVKDLHCPILVVLLSNFAIKHFNVLATFTSSNGKVFSYIPTGVYITSKPQNRYCLIQISEVFSKTYAVKANTEEKVMAASDEIRRKVHNFDIELTRDDSSGVEVEICDRNVPEEIIKRNGYEIYTMEQKMSETLSFAGWTPSSQEQIISWKEKFYEIYNDDGQLTLLSKEIYQAEADEDMPAFEYRYIIKAMDLQAFGSDQKTICFRLYMCPLRKYWESESLKGLSEDSNKDWFFEDAADSGILPYIGEEYLDYSDDDVSPDENGNKWYDYFYHITDWSKANEMLNIIATVLIPMNDTRGHGLDQTWNQLGNTGWDLLEYILNGKDCVDAALLRMHNCNN